MWSAEDLAWDTVRRQGRHGLTAGQVADEAGEAARRERETRRQPAAAPAGREPYDGDPEHLARYGRSGMPSGGASPPG
ncbi:hypothetical protein JCM4814A_94250 [Streptomyces phaeofaciens JCM 4814]|uniref:Uncharacterized protein n=1 Tax=Streptomyces phaeofaciens TaxID=68254 RepID=A0A918HT25_9ACTN|nr:hypothetical protein GCM10010226_90880 [Streptomyces phaeofaciens]